MEKRRFQGWKVAVVFLIMSLIICWGKIGFAQETLIEKGEKSSYQTLLDSLVKTFSAEDLIKFREFYQNEINRLQREKKLLREKNIQNVEKLLTENPNSHFIDKILLRLGEFYFQEAEETFLKQMDAYDKAYSEYEKGLRPNPPDEPKVDYSKALEKYRLIVDNFPNSSLYDDALYNLAYILGKQGKSVEAVGYYREIASKFPKSKYAPEALMQIGEYYFSPSVRNYDEAIKYYKLVLKYKDTPRYDEALYKIGWANYLKEDFPAAIASFTTVVQDIEKTKPVDYQGLYSNPSLENESLDYIGICFHDYGGLDEALSYLADLKYPDYGVRILKKLGDVYKNNEEKFLRAIATYDAILHYYPDTPQAPQIQNAIVMSFKRLEDNNGVYRAQREMFLKYHPGSQWAQAMEKKIPNPLLRRKTIREATELVKKTMQENINRLLTDAERDSSLDYYQQAVKNSRIYLKYFPDDSLAYTIHWNMAVVLDTKLNEDEEAFKEYEKIAFDYTKDKYRKDAAQNAIAVANEILEKHHIKPLKTAADDTSKISDFQKMAARQKGAAGLQAVNPDTLNADERRLIEAYNNFIKLFPQDKDASVALANAGILFYNKKQFEKALRYFNTLIQRFPNSPELTQAQFTAMESYFGKQDFVSAELMAKKIQLSKNVPEAVKKKAIRRMSESIFLHAQALADSGNHLAAAKEYRRVVKEVPNAKFADLALYQSAVEYDKVSEYNQAVEVYQYLIDHFPSSKYYLDAMNNLALDYGELKDYKYAANTYEKLWKATPDSAKAQDALYNASFFSVKAKDWRNAIRINKQYVKTYPKSADAENMFYNMAEYYLKLDDLDQANRIWDEFGTKYPDSPRGVETFFKRGEYFMNKGEHDQAIAEFDRALKRNSELKTKNLKTNDYYAAEALFLKSELMYNDYKKIRFTLANMEAQKNRKKELLNQLVSQYEEVAAYGTIRLYEATYDIGKVYEEFANAWDSQEIPQMDETRQIVYRTKIHQTSAQLYEKAHNSYRSAFVLLRKLEMASKPSAPDSTALADTTGKDSTQNHSIRVAEKDSTLRVMKRWVKRSGEKTSEMLYRIADLNFASIEQILSAPIPGGLDPVATLEYKNQVYLKAVKPTVDKIVQAHLRNINEADSLQLENMWVARSRQKLLQVFKILPAKYYQLAKGTIDTYRKMKHQYYYIMTKGTDAEKEDALNLAGDLLNVIELGKKYTQIMTRFYQWELDNFLKHNFPEKYAEQGINDYLENTYDIADTYKLEADSARALKDYFSALNQKDPMPEYEDAIYTYSDNFNSLHDAALEIAADAYDYKKSHNLQSLAISRISSLLIELDPVTYAKEFAVSTDSVYIPADSTWLVRTAVDSNWIQNDAPDSSWLHAEKMAWDSTGKALFPGQVAYSMNIPMELDTVFADTSAGDSVQKAASRPFHLVPKQPYPGELYFRKHVEISDIPVSAMLKIQADDNMEIFLNGVKVFQEKADTLGWKQAFPVNVNEFIRQGDNVVAIHVTDTDSTRKGMRAIFQIQLLRKATIQKVSQSVKQEEINYEKEVEKQAFLLNHVLKP
ncbi:MAG: tetratricopeptide repeat protein [Calditrichaeota bacterium]|nr:tetratricopeptide repeat protein [Calditrichota bacterium]